MSYRYEDLGLQAKTRETHPPFETHIILGTMARRRRRTRKPCLVSISRDLGTTETLVPAMLLLPVRNNVLLPANGTNENVDPNLVVPRRSKREHEELQLRPYNQGTWSDKERLFFLSAMRVYGLGRWKEIGTILTSRYERRVYRMYTL
jgi:hypothetical protein